MAVDTDPYWTSKPRSDTMDRLERLAEVVEEQDDPITVRALTYKLHPNDHGKELTRSYKNTCRDAVRARHLGLVPWDDIKEGRIEEERPHSYRSVDSYLRIKLRVDRLVRGYTLDKTPAHDRRIEAWYEKATVADEFETICSEYDVRCISTRGQMPWSAKKAAADRLDGDAVILYFGDNDEKGREICDVIERDLTYLSDSGEAPEVRWAAVTEEDEARLGLPPEARLDGLEPDDLRQVIRESITEYIDIDEHERLVEQEEEDKDRIRDRAETMLED